MVENNIMVGNSFPDKFELERENHEIFLNGNGLLGIIVISVWSLEVI